MGLNTEISWCDHTSNLFWGCVKVSPGCKFCYADTLDNRYNHDDRHWGPSSSRKLVRSWKKNLNDMRKSAIANNRRETVFVMSMGDIFEDDQPLSNNHDTNWKTINDVREEFFGMVDDYPELIFLLLTKRPENIHGMIPMHWLNDMWPQNVWFGTSIVNQDEVVPRLKALSALSDSGRTFISVEPMLGPVTLNVNIGLQDFLGNEFATYGTSIPKWVIVGGESGQKARPMNPDWVRNLRDECLAAGIPFHFKQWGENYPIEYVESYYESLDNRTLEIKRLKFEKRGKHNAGNVLDGKRHLGFPESFHQPLK